jgi:hypothetical protein
MRDLCAPRRLIVYPGWASAFLAHFPACYVPKALLLLGLEREMGFEPTTLCLGSRCSTTELFPLAEQRPATTFVIIVPSGRLRQRRGCVKGAAPGGVRLSEAVLRPI